MQQTVAKTDYTGQIKWLRNLMSVFSRSQLATLPIRFQTAKPYRIGATVKNPSSLIVVNNYSSFRTEK